jgi:Na+/H+-dicarboxylate symporter
MNVIGNGMAAVVVASWEGEFRSPTATDTLG